MNLELNDKTKLLFQVVDLRGGASAPLSTPIMIDACCLKHALAQIAMAKQEKPTTPDFLLMLMADGHLLEVAPVTETFLQENLDKPLPTREEVVERASMIWGAMQALLNFLLSPDLGIQSFIPFPVDKSSRVN